MSETINPAAQLIDALGDAQMHTAPYRHWTLRNILPEAMRRDIIALPVTPPAIGDSAGRRETHNATRWFFGTGQQLQFPVCAALAQTLQSPAVIEALEDRTAMDLRGSYLRIEYCLDRDGFWLEPHTDIGAKFFTMLIYLTDPAPGEEWGTDIYATPVAHAATIPFQKNNGLMFIPSTETWHGFIRRPITGIRRSLIVNYVTPDWRARHELAFPALPVL